MTQHSQLRQIKWNLRTTIIPIFCKEVWVSLATQAIEKNTIPSTVWSSVEILMRMQCMSFPLLCSLELWQTTFTSLRATFLSLFTWISHSQFPATEQPVWSVRSTFSQLRQSSGLKKRIGFQFGWNHSRRWQDVIHDWGVKITLLSTVSQEEAGPCYWYSYFMWQCYYCHWLLAPRTSLVRPPTLSPVWTRLLKSLQRLVLWVLRV